MHRYNNLRHSVGCATITNSVLRVASMINPLSAASRRGNLAGTLLLFLCLRYSSQLPTCRRDCNATLLAYGACDAPIKQHLLERLHALAV